MGGFYTFDEIVANLDSMYAHYPNLITQKYSIGTSQQSRTIWAVKISDNPNVNENEIAVGYDALIHAREPQSMASMLYFMWYLLQNYGTDPEVTYLVNNRELYFVPCSNPDGYEYNRTTNPGGGGMWRLNRRNNGNGTYGVDLNRNFGYMWGYDNNGSSPTPGSETYRGPSAFSEPETQALRDLALLKDYRTHFNMHSYQNAFLYPWGYIYQESPDSLIYREFASDMSSYNGYVYGTSGEILGYQSNGSVRDWMYGEQTLKGKTFGYTVEIGSESDDFWPPQSRIFPLAQGMLKPCLYNAWVAGEFVKLVNPTFTPQYIHPGDYAELSIPQVRNAGLSDASNISLTLTSNNPFVTINNGNISVGNITARTSVSNSQNFSFTLDSGIPLAEKVNLIVSFYTGSTQMYSDTISFIAGMENYFCENFTNLNNWTVVGPSGMTNWSSYNSNKAGGTAPELRMSWSPSFTGLSKIRSTTVSLPNNQAVNYSFNFFFDWYANPSGVVTLAVTYDNGVTSTPIYTLSNPTGNVGPELITGSFTTPSSGSENTKFEISYNGYTFNIDYIYWDDLCFYLIVPVELTSFTASVNKNDVTLNWATATETNNSGFDVERRETKDERSEAWTNIGFIPGAGTTTEKHNYSFVDGNLQDGKYQYRLKQIDYDGTFEYSSIVEVEVGTPFTFSLNQNYPNPFNPTTTIIFVIPNVGTGLSKSYVTLKVYDVLGNEVATLVNEEKEPGVYNVQFTPNKISSGIYFYKLQAGSFSDVKKMILMK